MHVRAALDVAVILAATTDEVDALNLLTAAAHKEQSCKQLECTWEGSRHLTRGRGSENTERERTANQRKRRADA